MLRQEFRVCQHGIAKQLKVLARELQYAKGLWIEELHHVFALKAPVSGTFHHVFALDLCFGGYLGHVSDASGSLCLVAVSYLDIWCFMF